MQLHSLLLLGERQNWKTKKKLIEIRLISLIKKKKNQSLTAGAQYLLHENGKQHFESINTD